MENLIDIRIFKGLTKYQFVDNKLKRIEKKLNNVELEFYELDDKIVNKLIEIDGENLSNEEYLYKIIPIISNVNMTVTLEEFEKMCKYPSTYFCDFIDKVMFYCKELFNQLHEMNELNKKSESINLENLVRVK